MRLRYIGPTPVNATLPGGSIPFQPGETIDMVDALEQAHIPLTHLEIFIRGLAGHPHWEVLDGPLDRPADSAPKADWVAYAIEAGLDPDDVAKATKAQLIEQLAQPTTEPTGTPGEEQPS